MRYRFVACTSYRFHQVYLDTFGREALTSIESAVASVSRAAIYLHSEEPVCDSHARSLFKTAAAEGKLEILMWGKDCGCELDTMLNCYTIADVVLNWHLEVVQYLRQLDISWDSMTCTNAAKNGHLEFLKWVRANQCPWNERMCTNAAKNGQLELLKWARANQCPWNELTCAYAAMRGHLELLKWARANGYPWMKWHVALTSHLELLKWARLNECPWDEETYALGNEIGDPALMWYLEDAGCPMWEESDNSRWSFFHSTNHILITSILTFCNVSIWPLEGSPLPVNSMC